ncbi:hypothetical protein Patl1_22703 [Pistacia atlantica]|uniref:Uncharacterized protein n=1 Tax=Pistacia atlantica TaxID=434234 RepID=A0ACC0ZZQ8_9ROSI|nr:hypothetical protein Patl1_22703 [Pistacia atlantica]
MVDVGSVHSFFLIRCVKWKGRLTCNDERVEGERDQEAVMGCSSCWYTWVNHESSLLLGSEEFSCWYARTGEKLTQTLLNLLIYRGLWPLIGASFTSTTPLSRRIYTILSARERGILLTRRPLDTKHGWGLFFNSTEDLRENYWRMLTALFLYSPFTDELIDLPDFSHKLGQLSSFSCVKGTFSTPPASSDCMIFLVMSYTDKYCIGICRPGDRKWTEFWFDCSNLMVSDVEYMDGVFYASFPAEAIGAFNIEQKEWKTYPYPSIKDQCGEYNCDFLTESDGKLLLSVYLSQDFWRFLRLDQSQMNWCPIERFDNKALFLGDASMMVPLEEETKELANTVSYFEDEYISPSQLPRMYQCNWGRTILEQVWIRPP